MLKKIMLPPRNFAGYISKISTLFLENYSSVLRPRKSRNTYAVKNYCLLLVKIIHVKIVTQILKTEMGLTKANPKVDRGWFLHGRILKTTKATLRIRFSIFWLEQELVYHWKVKTFVPKFELKKIRHFGDHLLLLILLLSLLLLCEIILNSTSGSNGNNTAVAAATCFYR